MEDGSPLRENEPWRKSKLLGSLLCSNKDIIHMINLANVAFSSFKKVWIQGSKVSLERKLQIYEAQMISVLLYNSSCWAAPKFIMEKLDICHRKHLRSILNIRWPVSVISNKALYKRCGTKPLSSRVVTSRMKMLGHVLRSPENSPAHTALCFADNTVNSGNIKGRVVRPSLNLLNVLKKDIESLNKYVNSNNDIIDIENIVMEHLDIKQITLNNYTDILALRQLAYNRKVWRDQFL